MVLLDAQSWAGRLYSTGWRTAAGGVLEVREPATGEVLATTGRASAEDVDRAAVAAAAAQPEWAATPPTERAQIFFRAARQLGDARAEVAEWIIRETGAARGKAEFEVGLAIDELNSAAGLLSHPAGELLPSPDPHRLSIARRVPLGVVGVIAPWNFPLILGSRSLAPALALGNAVLLKPDHQTPVVGGVVFARLLEEAGLPAGVLHVLPGDGVAGQALVEHPAVDAISFTGSSAVGRRIGELAGRMLKRVTLELGGNNALIVLDDADLDAASSAGAWGSFLHQGQICMSAGRHLVHERVAEQYVELLSARAKALPVGNPYTDDVALGPLISARQAARVTEIVDATVAAGGIVHTGGTPDGVFYPATVLSGVRPGMPAFDQEIFGPVAPITTFGADDEAVALANATEYGLVAAVQTGSVSRGRAVADRLRAGMVHVNDQTVLDEAAIPMGGRGASGTGGRYGGHWNLDEFTQWQWLTLRDTPARYPF